MIVGHRLAARAKPIRPALILRVARRHCLANVLCMGKCVERLPPLLDEHAQRQQRRAADAMLAVDQDLVAARDMSAREADPALEHVRACRLQVRRREMEEVDPRRTEALLVVAILLPQVDHRADAVLARELGSALDRKAGADREIVGQPVKIRRPASFRVCHAIFFIFFLFGIFFFIFPLARYCCFRINTVVPQS